jgi:hypothetical protein
MLLEEQENQLKELRLMERESLYETSRLLEVLRLFEVGLMAKNDEESKRLSDLVNEECSLKAKNDARLAFDELERIRLLEEAEVRLKLGLRLQIGLS